MFVVSEKVVYPGHGVAVIESILEKNVGGSLLQFFKLRFLFKDMTILVPLQNLENSGVRHLSNTMMIEEAMYELSTAPDGRFNNLDLSPSGWNRRHKEYQLKISSGQLKDIVKIYRDLMHISQHKDLSFGEKGLLMQTEDLLTQEITTIRSIDKPTFLQELRAPFKHFFVTNQSTISRSIL